MSLSGVVYVACPILNCSQICHRAIKGIVHPKIKKILEIFNYFKWSRNVNGFFLCLIFWFSLCSSEIVVWRL